jgi:hypothetical protein
MAQCSFHESDNVVFKTVLLVNVKEFALLLFSVTTSMNLLITKLFIVLLCTVVWVEDKISEFETIFISESKFSIFKAEKTLLYIVILLVAAELSQYL